MDNLIQAVLIGGALSLIFFGWGFIKENPEREKAFSYFFIGWFFMTVFFLVALNLS